MSFSIKPSHAFLKPAQSAPPKKTIDDLLKLEDKDEEKYDWLNPSSGTPTTATVQQPAPTAKLNASQGLVIRSSFRAQEDFM